MIFWIQSVLLGTSDRPDSVAWSWWPKPVCWFQQLLFTCEVLPARRTCAKGLLARHLALGAESVAGNQLLLPVTIGTWTDSDISKDRGWLIAMGYLTWVNSGIPKVSQGSKNHHGSMKNISNTRKRKWLSIDHSGMRGPERYFVKKCKAIPENITLYSR